MFLSYADLRDEISQIRQKVQLNLFGLSCQELNNQMFTRTENLRLGLIKFQVSGIFLFSASPDWSRRWAIIPSLKVWVPESNIN